MSRKKFRTKCLQFLFHCINVSLLRSYGHKSCLDTSARCARHEVNVVDGCHCPDSGMPRKSMNDDAAPGGTRINQELMDRLRSSTTGSKHISIRLRQNPAARSCSSRSPRSAIFTGHSRRLSLSRIHQKTVRDCLFYMAPRSTVRGEVPLASLQVP